MTMDSYGPTIDNAAETGEMAWSESSDENNKGYQQIMVDLDALGKNTNGLAIGSEVIAGVALFRSFHFDVSRVQASLGKYADSSIWAC
jgi:K(+)-stimulated pyrophosphate-energized sodium pump